jgi:S-adenosylmethionine decarboxylase proenzyme
MLDSTSLVERCLTEAVREANATVVETVFHRFSPHGVSGVVVIAESHVSIHTWPEHGYAAVDVFTCSDQIDPYAIMKSLVSKFSAQHQTAMLVHRGLQTAPEAAPVE